MPVKNAGEAQSGGAGEQAPGQKFFTQTNTASAASDVFEEAPHAARGGVTLDRTVLFITWLVSVPARIFHPERVFAAVFPMKYGHCCRIQFVLRQKHSTTSAPRSPRFLLGDRLQALAIDTVEVLVEAAYRKHPRDELLRANLFA